MNKRGKSILIISALLLVLSVLVVYFVFAATPFHATSQTTTIYSWNATRNESNLTFIVFNDDTSYNITAVVITLPNNFSLAINSNGSTSALGAQAAAVNFSWGESLLAWTNMNSTPSNITSGFSIVRNVPRNFWMYVNVTIPGTYGLNVSVYDNNSNINSTNINITVIDDTFPNITTLNANAAGLAGLGTVNASVFNTTNLINLTCDARDNVNLSSVRLYIKRYEQNGQLGFQMQNTSQTGGGTYNQTNFTHTFTEPGNYMWYCEARDTSGLTKTSGSLNLTVNAFPLTGWVKNSTYNNVSAANVSVYEFIMSQTGPPTERIIASVLTSENGSFNFSAIRNNGSSGRDQTIYKIKVTLSDSSGLITEIGPNLPQFPRDPLIFNMNGGTFYLQNATTFQLYSTNVTNQTLFGYEIIDNAIGFPVESNMRQNARVVNVTVPADRSYTIMYARDPGIFAFDATCLTGTLNESTCPSPPLSNTINSSCIANPVAGCNLSEGNTTINFTSRYLVTINRSLIYSQVNLTGCLNISGNASEINATDIITRMVPWTGFVPPMKADINDFDSTVASIWTAGSANKGCTLGRFNITLIGASSGVEYMIEAYANNTEGEYLGIFQNITMTGDKNYNLTLTKLIGTPSTDGDVATKKVEIAIMDENGTAPQSAHVEVYVKNPIFGTMHYIIETLTNGKFNFTLMNNTQEMRVMIYSNQYAPKEAKINLNVNRTNITLYSFRPQMMLDNGSIDSNKMSGSKITMRFMRNSAACNVYNPPISCRVGDDKNGNFDPLQAMMAGKVNLWMNTPANLTLYFINVDMLASGPPDAVMNQNVSSATSASTSMEQIWKLGSMAPDVYDKVMIGIPYNDTIGTSAENWTYNIQLPLLYDNDWNATWNSAVNTSAQLPSDYSDFNAAWFNGTGITCLNATSTSAPITSGSCYQNQTNTGGHSGYFWLTIPHFSSTAAKISGSTLAAATTTTTSSSPGGSSQATVYDIGSLTAVSKELAIGEKIKFSIEDKTNHTLSLLGMTASSATIQVTALTTTLTKSFTLNQAQTLDINRDGKDDIEVTLTGLSVGKAGSKSTATFSVRSLNVAAGTQPETPQENVTQPQENVTQQAPEIPITPAMTSSSWLKWTLIGAVAVIIAVVAILFMNLKKKPF